MNHRESICRNLQKKAHVRFELGFSGSLFFSLSPKEISSTYQGPAQVSEFLFFKSGFQKPEAMGVGHSSRYGGVSETKALDADAEAACLSAPSSSKAASTPSFPSLVRAYYSSSNTVITQDRHSIMASNILNT